MTVMQIGQVRKMVCRTTEKAKGRPVTDLLCTRRQSGVENLDRTVEARNGRKMERRD